MHNFPSSPFLPSDGFLLEWSMFKWVNKEVIFPSTKYPNKLTSENFNNAWKERGLLLLERLFSYWQGQQLGQWPWGFIPVEGEVVGIILYRWPYPCHQDKTELPLFQPTDASVVIGFWAHINRQMEELLWSAGNVELVPTLLSTSLKPEAHGLQAGLPAGFSKWRELCDQSGETVDYLSCV